MRKPEMVIFDYGNTILCEPGFSLAKADRMMMEYAVKNPNNYSADDVAKRADELYKQFAQKAHDAGAEIYFAAYNRLLFELMQIEFPRAIEEYEDMFFDRASPGAKMPNVEPMLAYLQSHNIRTAVLSNNMFSGRALTKRINKLLPDNNFEFIISTTDYIARKPNPLIFELALRKAGLKPGEVWYCGDDIAKDVNGSGAVGIFPVWYEDLTNAAQYSEEALKRECDENSIPPEYEHLHIHDWLEFIDLLEKLA